MDHINLPYAALVTKTKKEFKLHEERRYASCDKKGNAQRKQRLNAQRERDLENADY
jgi:hypothetical protein